MEVYDKIKFIRTFKGWTQETVADKLGISTRAYAKIERGETDVNLSRLQQIAKVMGIELSQLFGLNEKNVFNLTNSQCQHFDNSHVSSPFSIVQTEPQYESEKASFMIEQRDKEIEYLKQQVSDLREIIELFKSKPKSENK